MKTIGIFGGSFDPIHNGHLILAREALETLGLDQLLFIPAAQSPFKPDQPPAPAAARWEMLCAAIEGEPAFAASRIELDRPPPSYAIETIEQLRREVADAEFFYLIGEDNLAALPDWHRSDELQKLVQFAVLDRSCTGAIFPYPAVRRVIDISATGIRKRVASGRSIRYLVPEAVERIIRRENLYRGSDASKPKN